MNSAADKKLIILTKLLKIVQNFEKEQKMNPYFWSNLSVQNQTELNRISDLLKVIDVKTKGKFLYIILNKDLYLSKAKSPLEVWQKFAPYLYNQNNILVGQNILGYDIYILNVLMNHLGMKNNWSFLPRIVDTKALATALFKDIKFSGDRLSWQMRLMNFREKGLKTSQGFLLKHFGIDHDPSKLHNAMYDITMNYKIFRKLIMGVDV